MTPAAPQPSRPAPGRRLIDALGSGRLAIVLLAALSLLLFLYLFIPQGDAGDSEGVAHRGEEQSLPGRVCVLLGLTDVRHSFLLYGVLGLLSVNLAFCMIRRSRAAIVLSRLPPHPPGDYPEWSARTVYGPAPAPEEVARTLKGKGYRLLISDGVVYGVRGRQAVIGHWIFHASLLFLLAVGALIAAGPPPFRGTIGLGEGEPFDLRRAPFLATNVPLSGDLPDLRFDLRSIDIVTVGEEVRSLEARVLSANGAPAVLGINRPFRSGAYQVLVHGFGFMPGWVIIDEGGRMLKGAWVKLVPFPLEGEDSFRIGPRTSEVHVRFYPDHETRDGGDRTRSHELRHPRFRARIELLGETIFDGLLAPEQRVAIGGGRTFFFLPQIRRYLLVDVIREAEHRYVFAGLGLMILGLVLRYARLRKEIVARAEGGSLRIYGRCEILESLFGEELDRLAAALTRPPLPTGVRRTDP